MEHFVKAVNHPLLIQLLPPVINSVTLLIINQRIAICQVCNFTEKLKGKHLQMLCRVSCFRVKAFCQRSEILFSSEEGCDK